MTQLLEPVTCGGGLVGVPGSWFWLYTTLAVVANCDMNQQTEDISPSVSSSL